jgi:aryl-alcohol dehydrogenase-like predicted oxidoreductase
MSVPIGKQGLVVTCESKTRDGSEQGDFDAESATLESSMPLSFLSAGPLGYGAMGSSFAFVSKPSEHLEESIKTCATAIEKGMMVDTAWIYQSREPECPIPTNEELVSKAVDVVRAKGMKREDIKIATKFGLRIGPKLAWLIKKGQEEGVTVLPIPGTKSTTRLEENAGAVAIVTKLTDELMTEIESTVPNAQGDRYGPGQTTWEDRDPVLAARKKE